MKDIGKVIEERRITTFTEATDSYYPQVTHEPESGGGPVGVETYRPPNHGLIPILIYSDGSHVIPKEGEHQLYAKEFSSEYGLRLWIITYQPTVQWFIDYKGIRRCPRTGDLHLRA
jgi:hypothetical protein